MRRRETAPASKRRLPRREHLRCIIGSMPTAPELLTASKIAAALKVPDAKVKKAIAELKLQPAAKKGPCSYFDKAAVAKIKKAIG